MSKKNEKPRKPTTGDARVALKLYDLRREQVMRESRDAIIRWMPHSYDELVAITEFEAPNNAAFRQVSSYFEMAYGLARHGAVHREILAETCGEGMFLFAKVHPYLERFRAEISPTAFSNAEWIVKKTDFGRSRFKMFQARVAQMMKKAEGDS